MSKRNVPVAPAPAGQEGERAVPSGLAALLIATVPLWLTYAYVNPVIAVLLGTLIFSS